jgi:hypothetical protein
MAAVWRSVWAVTCLVLIDGQVPSAGTMYQVSRCSMASRLSGLPVLVGKSGSDGDPPRSSSQARRAATVSGTSGVRRSLSLPEAEDIRAGVQNNVIAGEVGQFRDPEPGLNGQQDQGVVASACPGVLVAGVQERVDFDFGFGDEGDEVAFEALGGDGQHALDGGRVFWMLQGLVGEQRVNRGQQKLDVRTTKAIGWRSNKHGKKTRTYDKPRTPYHRVIGSGILTQAKAAEFAELTETTNPADLTRGITTIQTQLIALAAAKTRALETSTTRAEIGEARPTLSRAS